MIADGKIPSIVAVRNDRPSSETSNDCDNNSLSGESENLSSQRETLMQLMSGYPSILSLTVSYQTLMEDVSIDRPVTQQT